MNVTFIDNIRKYLLKVLGVKMEFSSWKFRNDLPLFLKDTYRFYAGSLMGKECLFMIPQGPDINPSTLLKHLIQLRQEKLYCILACLVISSSLRKRLIEMQIPFIVPETQMFLPHLGIDLRENTLKERDLRNAFSPATQVVVLYALLKELEFKFTPTLLAKVLDYSKMTISRAFNELESLRIGTVSKEGRERLWRWEGEKQQLWEKAKPFMRSPVQSRFWAKGEKLKIRAGGSALSHFTHIAPSSLETFALGSHQVKKYKIQKVSFPDDADFELEVWQYDPALLGEKGVCDPLSLYLSLMDVEDERVEAALEDLMENVKW